MVNGTPLPVLADRKHGFGISQNLHRLSNRLHPLYRDHHSNSLPVIRDGHGMIDRFLYCWADFIV
jgi:hypothetical protein